MKTKLIFCSIAVLIFSSFVLLKPVKKQFTTPFPPAVSKFLFGAMESHNDYNIDQPTNSFKRIDSLGFNVNVRYVDGDTTGPRDYPKGLGASDTLFAPVSSYKDFVTGQLGAAYSVNYMRNILCRPKIEWLLHGQRSDYECENMIFIDTNYWFYSFQSPDSVGVSIQDSGKWVRFCEQGTDSPGWAVSRLRANTEQGTRSPEGVGWRGDEQCPWLVKPRIRIPASFITSQTLDSPICRIEIIDTGDFVKQVDIIKARHFRKNDLESYNGQYLEEFYFIEDENPSAITFQGALDTNGFLNARCHDSVDFRYSKADIKIYWYGNCDMWIDRIRVDNDVAHRLLKENDPEYEQWIEDEVEQIALHPVGDVPLGLKFYVEYLNFNELPCAAYVNEKLKQYSGNTIDLMADLDVTYSQHVNLLQVHRVNNPEHIYKNYIQRVDFTQIFAESYPMTTSYGSPNGYDHSKIPSTLPIPTGVGVFADAVSPSVYDTWLQDNLDRKPFILEGGGWTDPGGEFPQFPGYNRYWLSLCNKVSKMAGIPFIHMPQAHLWHWPGERRREPTNEELDMLANVAISYGARGFIYFWFPSHGDISNNNSEKYGVGMIEPPGGSNSPLRSTNVYGQTSRKKWEVIRDIGERAKDWEDYLLNFDSSSSYVYSSSPERTSMASYSFVSKLKAFPPVEFDPNPPDPDFGDLPVDSNDNAYLQAAFFSKSNDPVNEYNKYFMIVNKRCSPYLSNGSPDSLGGRRLVTMKVNPDYLPNFSNWIVYNLENGDSVAAFNKNNTNYVYIGDFMPGQGKLFKVSPVMQEGGTFVGNETCGNVNVRCKGNVFNGGYNLTIAANTTIKFDTIATINMNGGNFLCGGVRESWTEEHIGNDVTFTSFVSNTYWDGIEISNCNTVSIGGTRFEKIRSEDNLFAVNAVNCNTFRVRYSLFLSGSQNPDVGSVNFNFVPLEEVPAVPLIEITGNRFYHNSSDMPSVQIINSGSGQTSALIRINEFYGFNSTVGLLMNNVTGGSVKSNIIENYVSGISTAQTYTDFYKNYIQNSNEVSNGIELNSGSVSHLNFDLGITYQNSGINTLINYGAGGHSIETDNSYFTAKFGYNIFDISEYENHFYGTFDDYYNGGKEVAEYNCFKISGDESTENTDVDWYSGGSVIFDVDPYACEIPEEYEFDTVVYAEDIVDTLWSFSGGFGGGYSNEQNTTNITSEPTQFQLKTDSLNYHLRKRRFNEVKRIGKELTNSFSDSDRVTDIVQPLYFSTMITDDTNHTGISYLKTKLENLISNNSENLSLVLRCNYFIQKCKVILGEYSSALSGFYDIMQNYPYNWEGIVASWDYAATQLISQGGSGGGESFLFAQKAELDEPYGDDPKGTKKTVEKTLNNEKEKHEKQIKVEEQKVKELRSDVKNGKNIKQSKSLEKKLQQKKIMQEVIKPRKPETVIQHIKFVNSDIQKIYSINDKTTGIKDNNSIPDDYKLSQNYPNPFNPVTKIKFELPQESKVTIVIYDILGRKVAQLVNNELRVAGRYEIQFHGQGFASGVYFYKLVANDFVDTKRMVLVK